MKTLVFSIILFFCHLIGVQAQENYVNNITKQQEKRIDSLFMQLGNMNKPGAIIAIVNDNKLVYQKSFGAADISIQKPIYRNTKFQLGGMARHFTAFAILLLEKQNKLALTDRVQQYIPELTNHKNAIRIIDLLHQADGLYDINNLKYIAGKQNDFNISNKDIVNLISRQKELNFDPGTDFVDTTTDTSIILLAEVIATASGTQFSEFMKKEVFDPLGMKNTTFVESKNGSLTNVARSYINIEDKYIESETYNGSFGSTNLFSTIEDLIKWELHMTNSKNKNMDVVQKMNSIITLKNKKQYNVLQGQMTMGQRYMHYERDLFSIYHIGNYGGYASSMFKFPEQGFFAIVLSNNGEGYNGYYGVLASHIVLEDAYQEPAVLDVNTLPVVPISKQELKKFEAVYWDQRGGLYRTIQVQNDTLKYVRNNGNATSLYYLGNNKFQMLSGFDDKIFLTFELSGKNKKMWYQGGESNPILFENFRFIEEPKEWYKKYQGTYYCDMLQIGYDIHFEDNNLWLRNSNTRDIKIIRIKNELFHGDQWFLRSIMFKRDKTQILGFKTNMAELNGLWFRKIK